MELEKLIYPVFLDAEKDGIQQTVRGFFGTDTGEKTLCVVLTLGGAAYKTPDSFTAAFCAKKPDGSLIRHSCSIRGGMIYYTPGAELLDPAGAAECQVILFGPQGKVVCAPRFLLQTDDALWDGGIPQEPAASALLNWDVLGALSSPDGKRLQLHSSTIGEIAAVQSFDDLPEGTQGALAYVQNGTIEHPRGLYRFGTAWEYLPIATDDDVPRVPIVDALPQSGAQGDVVWLRGEDFYVRMDGAWQALTAPTVRVVNTYAEAQPLQEGQLYYIATSRDRKKGLYTCRNGAAVLLSDADAHTHANAATLAQFSTLDGAVLFSGEALATGADVAAVAADTARIAQMVSPTDDVALLDTQTVYTELYVVRDIDAVPWLWPQDNEQDVIQLNLVWPGLEDITYRIRIQLSQSIDPASGLPVRMLRIKDNGNVDVTFRSRSFGEPGAENYSQPGWKESDVSWPDGVIFDHDVGLNEAFLALLQPDFLHECLQVESLRVGETTYTDFSALPVYAKSVLWTLSQMLHAAPDKVDHPYVPSDAVTRFTGEITPGHKYWLRTGYSFEFHVPAFDEPEIAHAMYDGTDLQFVLYVFVTSALIDMSIDNAEFIGGAPEMKYGWHKLIGTWDPAYGLWFVGDAWAEVQE